MSKGVGAAFFSQIYMAIMSEIDRNTQEGANIGEFWPYFLYASAIK